MTNKYAIDLIKKFEGCKLNAYKCPAGVWTIGWGQTGSTVVEGVKITQGMADDWLFREINSIEDKLKNSNEMKRGGIVPFNIWEKMQEHQKGALISFCYNFGVTKFLNSTLFQIIYNMLNDFDNIEKEWLKWNKAKGKVLKGLTARRQAEFDCYKKGVI